jgi:PAS domain S-box-containing protein
MLQTRTKRVPAERQDTRAALAPRRRARAFTTGGLWCLILSTQVQAQELERTSLFDAVGDLAIAGMLAGLLVFALAALWNHHRSVRNSGERIGELRSAIETRDDRIWRLEEQLARANELVDAQGDLVLREDSEGRITHASAAACALLGKKPGEIIGKHAAFRVIAQGERAKLSDGSVSYDQEIATKDGPRWIAWKEAAIRDELGAIKELQRVGRDVTARVAVERALAHARTKAEAASRAKSRFLAVVSHEVRTPLNGILGMTGLLLDTPLSPEQRTYAQAVKTSGEALLALIDEILDFSKIEAGRLDLESVSFDLTALVTVVIELIAPHAQEKGIEIAVDLDDKLPTRVTGDAARLRQVLLNLAGNAVKFTDQGGVAVVVEREDGDRIRFWVSDTGPGIGREAQARIFKEFEQGDSTLARRHGGTGLGLAIASRIVERMGGQIELESSDEEGSTFTFSIELPAVSESGAQAAIIDLSGEEILVASPSPVVGPLLVRRLNAWHAKVAIAQSPEVAKALLPERSWSTVLIDRAFGARATAEVAQASAGHAERRYVLVAPAERAELEELKNAGFDGYLVKPIRAASLAARVGDGQASPPLVPELPEPEQDRAPGRRMAVLVAEDNDINGLLAQALLARLGHAPTVVPDGVSALTAVATAHAIGAPYDLVLMDLHLPGMDGLEATRKIRALGAEEGGLVPIVALTANVASEDREACVAAGMDAFLVKPIDRERLAEAIALARGARAAAVGRAA